MTRNRLTQDFSFVIILARWIEAYYLHKFERYVAAHELAD